MRPIRDGESGEWQDRLVDEGDSHQESVTAESDELENRRNALSKALTLLSVGDNPAKRPC